MCYHFLNKMEMKKVSAPIRLRLLYLLYFFYERRSAEALETGTVRHRRDIVRRFDVEDQASQHIHFSDPLGGIMHKLPLLI